MKTFFRLLAGLLALSLTASCSGSDQDANISTSTIVVTTQARNGNDVTVKWLDEGTEYLQTPDLSGIAREEAIMKLSSYQSGLADYLEMTKRNPDPLISTSGAEWVSQLSSVVGELLTSLRNNDKEGLSVALGRYDYLRSPQKTSALTNCLTTGINC